MSLVLREDRGPVRVLTMNRPEVRNAISLELLRALRAELAEARASEARVLVLTGAGPAFCAGGDVQQMLERQGQALATADRLRGDLAGLLRDLAEQPQPVLARVHGDAVGAGLGLALACDLSIAAEEARVGAPFVGLGLIPDTALTYELPRRMGLQRAMDLVLTGQLVPARDAGVFGRVVPAAQLDGAVEQLAARLAQMPARTLTMAKRALRQGAEGTRAEALDREAWLQGICFTTPEHAAGVRAFLDRKR